MKRNIIFTAIVALFVYISFSIWIISDVKKGLKIAFLSDGEYKADYAKYVTREVYLKTHPQFFYSYSSKNPQEFKHSLIFPLHIFARGVVWTRYTYTGSSPGHKEALYGAGNVPIRLHVQLHNGTWKIVEKDEKP
ncbi:MAG: hypothetical protein JWM44_3327 [Bacilli bacterium]|nr:hypothetical protein [Bacilli bacterium]